MTTTRLFRSNRTQADILAAVEAGAMGYLLKDRVSEVAEFLDALSRVAAGGTAMDPEVVSQLLARREPLGVLTPREREVLGQMAEGRSNAAIAGRLFISAKTVSVHLSNLMAKLGAASRTEAVAVARRTHLLG